MIFPPWQRGNVATQRRIMRAFRCPERVPRSAASRPAHLVLPTCVMPNSTPLAGSRVRPPGRSTVNCNVLRVCSSTSASYFACMSVSLSKHASPPQCPVMKRGIGGKGRVTRTCRNSLPHPVTLFHCGGQLPDHHLARGPHAHDPRLVDHGGGLTTLWGVVLRRRLRLIPDINRPDIQQPPDIRRLEGVKHFHRALIVDGAGTGLVALPACSG